MGINKIILALKTAGLHTMAEEVEDVTENVSEDRQTRRDLKKKAIDLAATIRDSMGNALKDKLTSDMVEGATLNVEAVMELVEGELDRIEDKLGKGIWDSMEAAVDDWDKDDEDDKSNNKDKLSEEETEIEDNIDDSFNDISE